MFRWSRRGLLSAVLSLPAVLGATGVYARPINSIVAFGDSLTDNGNLSALSGGTFPDTTANSSLGERPAYLAGRLSNGTTWAENLAASLGVPLTNRAFAAALTDTRNTAQGFLPAAQGMQTSVNAYVGSITVADPNTLFVLWGGANNYFNINPGNPVGDLSGQVNQLIAKGASQFLIVNLPNLGDTPGGAASGVGAALNGATALHNTGIAGLVSSVDALAGIDAKLLDVNALFTQVRAAPGAFGLTNVTTPYVRSGIFNGQLTQGFDPTIIDPTQNADNYLFYDEIHPTAAAHRLIAQRALAVVVPEGGTAGLLAVGGAMMGAGLVVRRRRKKA